MMGGGIFGLLFIGLLFYFFFSNFHQSNNNKNQYYKNKSGSEEALETLKMRFANGKINEEEYIRIKSIIQEESFATNLDSKAL